ncbi:NUDIX hydrolase [Candidatus Villigracilis affinis]|uniref:NUDIX hydrolase n=1 Tax=Candidatus Villigracilis affinis TaxID=3140682 RepID=UPI001D283ED8|nr:NUDIX hydrolase [Anaerolineales bacterium]
MEKWIKKEEIHKGKIFSLMGGQVSLDNGEIAVREYIQHSGGVAIVPVIDDSVILIRQFRISIERELIELPAGRLEPNENPMDCAARELEEEIGYRANKLIPIASYFASVGNSNERMYLFLALDLEKTERQLEADERIREVAISLETIKEKLRDQEFEDSKTIIGLREALAYFESNGG